ncbi:DUF4129 domain-containing protein [Flaviaesturariibacter terrae]
MRRYRYLFVLAFLLGPLVPRAQQDTAYATDVPATLTDTVTTSSDEDPDYATSSESEADSTWAIGKPVAADSSRVAVRPLPPGDLDNARAEDDFWYWNYRKKKHKKQAAPERSSPSEPLGIPSFVFWILITAVILALLHMFLLSININVFAKRGVELGSEEEAEAAEDIFNRNFEREIAAAVAGGDYRLAIRLRYLQLLRELSDRNIIQYRSGATNGVYVSQLWGSAYYTDFFRITRTFEYAWYGMLPVTQTAYERMQQDVAHLKTRFS